MITQCNKHSLPSIYVNSCLHRGTHYSLMAYNIRTESASSTSHRSLPVAGLYTGIFLPLQDSCHSLLMNSCDIKTEKNNPVKASKLIIKEQLLRVSYWCLLIIWKQIKDHSKYRKQNIRYSKSRYINNLFSCFPHISLEESFNYISK